MKAHGTIYAGKVVINALVFHVKITAFSCSILSHCPTGLNGHPIVEELCQFLDYNKSEAPFYFSFLVDRMEEMMKSDPLKREVLLPKADQVRDFFGFLILCNEFVNHFFLLLGAPVTSNKNGSHSS